MKRAFRIAVTQPRASRALDRLDPLFAGTNAELASPVPAAAGTPHHQCSPATGRDPRLGEECKA